MDAFVPASRDELYSWLTRFNEVVDSLDSTRLGSIFAKQVRVQFAEVPILEGLDAAQAYFRTLWSSLESMEHEIDAYDMAGDRIYMPCHITWRLQGDDEHEEITVRALSILRISTEGPESGLVYDARFYLDAAPLMSGLNRVAADKSRHHDTEVMDGLDASISSPDRLPAILPMMATPNTLTLSSATFAKLSPHPYLLANLEPSDASIPSARTNGRQPREARSPYVNTSSLSHAHGSAVVRTGDTTVICGIRAETLLTNQIPNYRVQADSSSSSSSTDELRDYDLLVPNIELATGCAPNFLPGVPPTALAQTLSTRVYSLLHSSKLLDASDLRITHTSEDLPPRLADEDEPGVDGEPSQGEVKAYWVLYIDVLFISLDGNPLDAAWASIVAALRDTKLPKAFWDPDREMILCDREASPLSVRGLPIACTAAVFTAKERQQQKKGSGQFWILVDPDRLEESLCNESVTVVVDRSQGQTQIMGLSKSGGTNVGPEVLRRFTAIAEERWEEFRKALA
ncbi:ribosomal protein S5 domain 2-type protein [Microdochium bolleyi]|uniref:Ribosomal RNA-processing protein 43 n=1 Tax=Microdochium bolleyi TaxID=196109 RepID=A0A136JA84_9PEZI|nr:ribosomal protein S5 domain 2-type protein [Microdochium bolleyi]